MADETFESWYKYYREQSNITQQEWIIVPEVSKDELIQYAKQRTCAKCGTPASAATPLFPREDGKKFCENCLDGKEHAPQVRKYAWEQAYYDVCNDERRRLDVLLFKFMDTLPLYNAERKFCRLCNSRMGMTTKMGDAHQFGFSKYHQYGPRFRTQAFLKMKTMFAEWQKHWYYQTVWRWNPAKERISMCEKPIGFNYKWEDFFPLVNDPAIHAAGVEIGARVEVSDATNGQVPPYVKGRVVFRLDGCPNVQCISNTHPQYCQDCPKSNGKPRYLERTVDCTHVAIATIPLTELPINQEEFVLDSKGQEHVRTTENHSEIKLDPEEHYVALRSYVQGIAEVGLETMFSSRYPDDPLSLPFGFNTLMQKQVLYCLKELCPNAAKSILYKAVGYVLESAPDEWILSRITLLNNTYGFTAILKEHEFWQIQDEGTQKRIVVLYGKLAPPKHITGGNTQNVIYVPAADGAFIPFQNGVFAPAHREWFIYRGTVPLAVGIPVVRVDTTQVRSIRAGEIPYGHIAQFNGDRVEVVHHVPGVIEQHQADQRFRREMEAPFILPDDALHVPENVLRGITAETQEQNIRNQALVERYLLAVSAAVGMPIERFQNIIPQLLQLNDVRRAAVMVNTYYAHPVVIPQFDPREF